MCNFVYLGGGSLLSEKAALEKAATKDVIIWELSKREFEIIKKLGK